MLYEGGPDGRVKTIEANGRLYVGGRCDRFGCGHGFDEHDYGTVEGGGECHGTRPVFSARKGETEPCQCRRHWRTDHVLRRA